MKEFLLVDDVMDLMQCGQGKGYQIIREINNEMKQQGFITMQGRVNRKFLYKKLGIVE